MGQYDWTVNCSASVDNNYSPTQSAVTVSAIWQNVGWIYNIPVVAAVSCNGAEQTWNTIVNSTTVGLNGSVVVDSRTFYVNKKEEEQTIFCSASIKDDSTDRSAGGGTKFGSTSIDISILDDTKPLLTVSSKSSTTNSISFTVSADLQCNNWSYSIDSGRTWVQFSSLTATSASCTINNLLSNVNYTVFVKASKALTGIDGLTSFVTSTLDASKPIITVFPSIITIDTITLTAASNETCNNWCYKINNGEWIQFSNSLTKEITFVIQDLESDTEYTIWVKATKVSNNIDGSSIVSVNTLTESGLIFCHDLYLAEDTRLVFRAKIGNSVYKNYLSINSNGTAIVPRTSIGSLTSSDDRVITFRIPNNKLDVLRQAVENEDDIQLQLDVMASDDITPIVTSTLELIAENPIEVLNDSTKIMPRLVDNKLGINIEPTDYDLDIQNPTQTEKNLLRINGIDYTMKTWEMDWLYDTISGFDYEDPMPEPGPANSTWLFKDVIDILSFLSPGVTSKDIRLSFTCGGDAYTSLLISGTFERNVASMSYSKSDGTYTYAYSSELGWESQDLLEISITEGFDAKTFSWLKKNATRLA